MIWDESPQDEENQVAEPGSELWHKRLAMLFAKIAAAIDGVGWFAISVPVGEHPFAYTIGLTETYDHPELIVYGMGGAHSHQILASAIHWIKEEHDNGVGKGFQPGERYSGVLEDYDVEFREHPARPLDMARAYYGVDEIPALQLVWPDAEGNFPGEEGMDPDFEKVQEQQGQEPQDE